MLSELTDQIEDTGVQAAWIKVSAGDDGITPAETLILRAAARAAAQTGATIGSHTIRGRVVLEQLDIVAAEGVDPGPTSSGSTRRRSRTSSCTARSPSAGPGSSTTTWAGHRTTTWCA